MFLCGFGILIFEPGLCATSFGVKLHHRRRQAVGGFKKWFGTHEIAATGMMKMSAISAGNHFIYVYFVRFPLLYCNAKCQKTMTETSDGGATIWIETLESTSIGLSNWMCWKHRRMKLKDDIILNPGVLWTSDSAPLSACNDFRWGTWERQPGRHGRQGLGKVGTPYFPNLMTFLQPQPEGSKIIIFIKKISHHLLKNYP